MAPHVTSIVTVARSGARAVRYLIRPARANGLSSVNGLGRDPWLPQGETERRLHRTASLTRRGLGLFTLLALSLFATMILGTAVVLLGIGVANGVTWAGWLLALTLLTGLMGLFWTARRASAIINPAQTTSDPSAALVSEEQALLELLRAHERALPAPTQAAFRDAVISTRDALRASQGDELLSRDAFDARQAARADLPELLDAYRRVPESPQSDQQFLEQLALIEQRMQTVIAARPAPARTLKANRRYLEEKYNPSGEASGEASGETDAP